MDFYLLNNHATSEINPTMPNIIFNTMNGDEIESFDDWNEVTTSNLVFQFDTKENLADVSSKSLSFSSDILQSITTGKGAGINGGIAFISSTVRAYVDVQRRFEMALLDRLRGAVFVSNRFKSDYQFRGIPKLKLNIQPSSTNGTLVVYLLAVDDFNFGHLFTFSPWTFKNADVNQMLTVDIDLTMTSYDFPAGHRLGIVVSSHDTLYLDQSPPGMKIEFLGGSILTIPIHV
jgi:predicted acyl esterase